EDLDLGRIEPTSVGGDHVLPEEADAVKELRGPQAGLHDAVVNLPFRLGQVQMDQGSLLVREFPDPEEGVLRDRVDGVRSEPGRDSLRLQRLDPAVRVLGGPKLLRGPLRIVEVHDPFREEGPQPHLLHGLRGLVHVEVHVVEGRRPGLDHLEARELRAPEHVFGPELRVRGPDLRLEPGRQIEVVRPATEQGHRGMRVQVHEARQGELPPAVDHGVRFALLPDLRDPISLDVDVGDVSLDLDVLDQDAHRSRPSAPATTVRVRAAFARCVSRIVSKVSGSSTMPWAKLSTVQRDAYGIPSSDAKVASDAIVIPTTSSGTTKLPGRIAFFRDPVDEVPITYVAPTSFRAQRFARWFSLWGGIR